MPFFLPPHPSRFPHPIHADNDGLLAYGGDLSTQTLLKAYQAGIFPWYNADENSPILWWSPDPRCVITPHTFKPSRSLKKTLKSQFFYITVDQSFTEVIKQCAAPRSYANSTWINDYIIDNYSKLHLQGIAHSIEVWTQQHELVGGLYGLNLGQLFFGESMFSWQTDASKVAFAFLMKICRDWQFPLVDCQLPNPHLLSLGATTISRQDFLNTLASYKQAKTPDWSLLKAGVHLTNFKN